ncbi:MAG: DeoR/GlpR family DNA-binding transcription regulator [Spirochaetaceae bacterium]
MAINRRHEDILKILTRLRSVSVADLTERLGVSEVTIRKDLTVLEEMGYLMRTRGGAELAEDKDYLRTLKVRREEHLEAKREIARQAAQFIREDDTIFIDSGSTCTLFAEEIKNRNLRIVTNSLDVMNTLADTQGITLISIGGNYRKEAGSFIGPTAEENLEDFQLETCFLGATGFSREGLFSAQNVIESRLKAKVLGVSKRRVLLADSSKFEKSAFSVFARAEDVDVLITDNGFTEVKTFQAMGIEVPLVSIH